MNEKQFKRAFRIVSKRIDGTPVLENIIFGMINLGLDANTAWEGWVEACRRRDEHAALTKTDVDLVPLDFIGRTKDNHSVNAVIHATRIAGENRFMAEVLACAEGVYA
jgi:hypothetical protein